jgi:hypothetical protein
MVNRAHAAWTNAHITGMPLMEIKAAFPRVAKRRLVNLINVRQLQGDRIRWTESFLSERTVEQLSRATPRHDTQWWQRSHRADLCHRSSLQSTPQHSSSRSKCTYQRVRSYPLYTTLTGWRLDAISTMSSPDLRDTLQRAWSAQADEGYSSTLQRRRWRCSCAGGATGNTFAEN